MKRSVIPERLDELPPSDPAAIRSRHDLQRLNRLMGHPRLMVELLQRTRASSRLRRLVELGAGDGTFLLRVVQRLAGQEKEGKAVLVDRQDSVRTETRREFVKLGWEVEVATVDVFKWLLQSQFQEETAMMSNLFLHHFQPEELRALLHQAASRTGFFFACEPRRSRLSLAASRLVGLIGCNAVTRHDAVVSVRAGFVGRELMRLWPESSDWCLEEGEAGIFSHVFAAYKRRFSSDVDSSVGSRQVA